MASQFDGAVFLPTSARSGLKQGRCQFEVQVFRVDLFKQMLAYFPLLRTDACTRDMHDLKQSRRGWSVRRLKDLVMEASSRYEVHKKTCLITPAKRSKSSSFLVLEGLRGNGMGY